MNKKEMKKLALQIYQCELIHDDPSSTQEEISQAEQKIMELTNKICSAKDGINVMLEIDIMVQELVEKNKNNL